MEFWRHCCASVFFVYVYHCCVIRFESINNKYISIIASYKSFAFTLMVASLRFLSVYLSSNGIDFVARKQTKKCAGQLLFFLFGLFFSNLQHSPLTHLDYLYPSQFCRSQTLRSNIQHRLTLTAWPWVLMVHCRGVLSRYVALLYFSRWFHIPLFCGVLSAAVPKNSQHISIITPIVH